MRNDSQTYATLTDRIHSLRQRLIHAGGLPHSSVKMETSHKNNSELEDLRAGFAIAACMEAIFEHEPVKSWIKDALKEDEFLTFNKPYRADENPNQITKMKRLAY